MLLKDPLLFAYIVSLLMAPARALGTADVLIFVSLSLIFITVIYRSRRPKTTPLNGPRNTSFIFGFYRYIQEQDNPGLVYETWAEEYGPAYLVSGPFGSKRVVICDPKANAHFYSRETYGYVQTKLSRVFIENLVCRDRSYRR